MRTRKLGSSGIEVGEIGLGTWGLSGEAYGPITPDGARETVEAALDASDGAVTFIDTAAPYGMGHSVERMIGEVIHARGAQDRAFVATRIGVDRDMAHGTVHKRFDRESLTDLANVSLQRLQLDCVGSLVLHNPMVSTLRAGEAVGTLQALKAAGKCRLVGVSVGSYAAGIAALEQHVDLIELPYSLFHPRDLHALAGEISAAGVAVVARSVLSFGVLADTWSASRKFRDLDHRNERWAYHDVARRVRQREATRFLVKPPITSVREAAIRYVLANQLVSVAVIGARSPEMVRQNAKAAEELPYLPPDDLATLGTRLRDEGIEF